MNSFVIVIRSAYFQTQKRRNYAKSVGVNRSDSRKRSLYLPKRPELPERPRNTGKTIQKDIWQIELNRVSVWNA